MSELFVWAPPLPFVNEFLSLISFFLDSLDDCCEDLMKLLFLAVVAAAVRRAMSAAGPLLGLDVASGGRLGVAFAVVAVGAVYPFVDRVSDRFAHHAQLLQESCREALGVPPEAPEPIDALEVEKNLMLSMVDDIIEDSFKSACVFSHYTMGALLGGTMRRIVAEWFMDTQSSIGARYKSAAGRAMSTLVIVGTPAGRYAKCDQYGDKLGDLVQEALVNWTSGQGTALCHWPESTLLPT